MSFSAVIKKYFYFVMKEKRLYFLTVFLVILAAVLSMVSPLLYGKMIDAIPDFEKAINFLWLTLILIFFVELVEIAWKYLSDRIYYRVFERQAKIEFLNAVQNADYEYHTDKSSGSLISLAKRGARSLFTLYREVNLNSFRLLIQIITPLVILSWVNIKFFYILFFTIVSVLFFGIIWIKSNKRKRDLNNKQEDKISGMVIDSLVAFESVRIFAREKWEEKKFFRALDILKKYIYSYADSFRHLELIMGLINVFSLGSVFFIGLKLIEKGEITIGVFVASMVYVWSISGKIWDLAWQVREFSKAFADISLFFEVLSIKPTIRDPQAPVELKHGIKGKIDFDDVSFKYSKDKKEKARYALENIDVSIKPNEKVAFVGKSGSGKTTLTKLLMRFYDVTKGAVKLDDIDIRQLRLKDLRTAIGLVPQEPVLFNDTIRYNIAYGDPEACFEKIQDAAQKAQLHEFIETLPRKYDTIVGERGIKLSGGQKQRLAIARVILENPEIVVFDEATSQLDSENEQRIHIAFDNLTKNKTTIIVAHRLSTVMDADRIIVFQEGRVVQEGTHNELSSQKGVYQGLWRLQTERLI